MHINYSSYSTLDTEDLKKIIENAQSIIEARDKSLIESIKLKNLNGLIDVLKYNSNKLFSKEVWQELQFNNMTSKDWDFFNFIVKLPQYEEMNKKLRSNNGLNKTQEAIVASFADKKLFDLFMEEPNYKNLIKDLARSHAIENTTSKEVINTLLEHKILLADKDLLNQAISRQKGNFLEYFIENKTFDLHHGHYAQIYEKGWSYLNDKVLDIVKDNYKGYQYNNLKRLLENLSNGFSSKAYYEQYKQFVKLDTPIILRTLKVHEAHVEDVTELIKTFNNLSPTQNNKFMDVAQALVEKKPEFLELFKKSCDLATNKKFKTIYLKVIECLDISSSLEIKEVNNSSKLKI